MIPLVRLFCVVGIAFTVAACGSKKKDYADRMAEEHKDDNPVANGSANYEQEQPVETQTVTYATTDSGDVKGYLAKPQNADENLPGIIVIHEWWGLNDNVRMMTERLAGLGYTALAVDLYGGQVASSSDFAKKYMQEAGAHPDVTIDNLKQAYTYLTEQQDAEKVGTIGWCFGGGWSLQTALALPDDIDATVIYYGHLVTDMAQLRTLNMPILGFFGGQDQGIPPETVNTFKKNLKLLDKDAAMYIYDDANHAFANPSGTRYNKEAAQDAWQKTKAFFAENLKN